MNHSKHYSALIVKALVRQCTEPLVGYYEKHHILPRSQGGNDLPGNIVFLTVKEHFLAHLLLAHMPSGEQQWCSVGAILQDALNPLHHNRFGAVRGKRWIRKRIAFQRAKNQREVAKRKLNTQYNRALDRIEAAYANDLLDALTQPTTQ